MSETDSFIQEVTEELRRERVNRFLRRYGWIGVLLVVLIVGGTAVNEWLKMRAETRAQAFGAALTVALERPPGAARVDALVAVPASDRQQVVRDLIAAAAMARPADGAAPPAEDVTRAAAMLDAIIGNDRLPVEWRDLAVLQRVLLTGAAESVDDRRAALEAIAVPGRPYRALADEQLAYLLIEEGRVDEARDALGTISTAEDATPGQRARVAEVAAALGGGAAEVDAGDEDDVAPTGDAAGDADDALKEAPAE